MARKVCQHARPYGSGNGNGLGVATTHVLRCLVVLTLLLATHRYSATKAGLSAFASGLWAEVREAGILVSTVYPGLVATGMGDEFQSDLGPLIDRRVPKEECVVRFVFVPFRFFTATVCTVSDVCHSLCLTTPEVSSCGIT